MAKDPFPVFLQTSVHSIFICIFISPSFCITFILLFLHIVYPPKNISYHRSDYCFYIYIYFVFLFISSSYELRHFK
ncbi:hypothetical protein J3Q64DRAFT_1055010 [Phycomyces blakesleeanus]|uniref:Uncharacterized protein n=1 Tax=Phycomyces blakesleeanus TaxID=4837 RepID=A0ABR3BIF7_PHYBL